MAGLLLTSMGSGILTSRWSRYMALSIAGTVYSPAPGEPGRPQTGNPMLAQVTFKRVGDGRPDPDHRLGAREWAAVPTRTGRHARVHTVGS
jgi:hypothetical protein